MSKGQTPPEGRKTGPKKRNNLIHDLMLEVLSSDFLDEWRTSTEIASKVNNKMSKHWSPVTTNVISGRMRGDKYINLCNLYARQISSGQPGNKYMVWVWRKRL